MNEASVLFRGAEVDDHIVDVRCDAGLITEVGEPGSIRAADTVIDADGGALLPGLHDHHIHLFALAAARASLDVSKARDAHEFDAMLRLCADGLSEPTWLRGVGYHEAVHGALDRTRLDDLAPGRKVRMQHRTGAMWVISSAAIDATGVDLIDVPGVERDSRGVATGRLYGVDGLLRDRFDPVVPDVAAIGRELATYGVTGVTDLTPSDDAADVDALAAAALAPDFPMRVVVTGGPRLPLSAGVGLTRGPVKLVIGDDRMPTINELADSFRRARSAGRAVAVHCVTRVALVLAIAVWEVVGAVPGDRIEHGAVVPLGMIDHIRRLGLVVVTQPSFVAERGDQYLADVEPDDLPHLWRCGSLLDRGVGVAGSTDAPYGHASPWHAIAAAVDRRAPSGEVVGPAERLNPSTALALFLGSPGDPGGSPRQVGVGEQADLCLLGEPLAVTLTDPLATNVVVTLGRAGLTFPSR